MKKLITLALAALTLGPLINASDKGLLSWDNRELITDMVQSIPLIKECKIKGKNKKTVKSVANYKQLFWDNLHNSAIKEQLFWDNLHKCGLIKGMVKEDLEQLKLDNVTGDTFAQKRRLLVQKAAAGTWLQYTEAADGERINPDKLEDMFNTFNMLIIEPLENVTQKLEKVDGETLINLLPFCHYMLIEEPLLEKIEYAFAQKTGELIAKNNSHFETKAGKRLLKVLKWHGFKKKERMLPEPIAKIFSHQDPIEHVIFSHDGTKLVTTSEKTAQVWDVATGKLLKTFTHTTDKDPKPFTPDGVLLNHNDDITYAAFSPNDETLATASRDKTAKVWDVTTGKLLKTFTHNDYVNSLAFSPNGETIATASEDGTAQLWDVATGEHLKTFTHNNFVKLVIFSPNGKTIATTSGRTTQKLWDVDTNKCLLTLDPVPARNVAFSPNGKTLAASSMDYTAQVLDISTGKILQTFESDSFAYYVIFSPDGKTLATTSEKTAQVWDVATGKLLQTFKHDNQVLHVAFSPNGETLATALRDKTTKLWNVATGELLQTFKHDDLVLHVAFSPDGKTIATISDDTAQLWTFNPELPLADIVIIKGLHKCNETGTIVDVTTNKKLGTLINKLPTTIKKYYIESGVVKNLVPRNRKFFDNRMQHLRKGTRYAYSYLTSH